jgi:hypothetical protein
MKKILILILAIAISSQNLFAQDTIHLKRNMPKKILVTDRPPQAFFAELYGRSLIFSINYDTRFSNRVDGLGLSAGIGFVGIDGESLFSIPLTLNYLLGKDGKYLELGVGATYFSAHVTDDDDAESGGSTIIGTMTIGYRSQPVDGGFMFRAGINPLFFERTFVPWPYVSVGYNF